MMMATWSRLQPWLWLLLCITKYPDKKGGAVSGGPHPQTSGMRPGSVAGAGGVADNAIENLDVLEEAPAARRRHAAGRQRSLALERLDDFDHLRFLKHLQVTAQIAVGQPAQLLQIGECQALRMDDERRQDAEPRLLMDHAVEALIGERSCVICLRHRGLRARNGEWRPAGAGRPRKARPSPRTRATASRWTA